MAFREELGTSIAGKAFTLKVLNLLLAKYHFRERNPTLLSRPFGLVVDPANGCNLACPGCVHSRGSKELKLFDWDKGLLSEERFEALLQQFGTYAVNVRFYNYGEPTANLNTPKFIKLAKSYLIQTLVSINATVERFDAEAYVRSGLDFMLLSIDGATQPVYEQFRKNGHIELAFENILKLVDAKKRLGKETPILRWQYLAFEHNAHEIPAAREIAAALGVDQFTVETPFDVSWDVSNVRVAKDVPPSNHELREGTEDAFSRNWDFDLKGTAKEAIEREFAAQWTSRLAAPSEPLSACAAHTCSWLYKSMVMDANGHQNSIDHVNYSVGLVHVRDTDAGGPTLFITQNQILAAHHRGQRAAADGLELGLTPTGLNSLGDSFCIELSCQHVIGQNLC